MSALDDLQYQMPLDFQDFFNSLCNEAHLSSLGGRNDQVVVVVKSHKWPVGAKLHLIFNPLNLQLLLIVNVLKSVHRLIVTDQEM